MLDLVTGAAELNGLQMSRIDCVSSLSEDKYNLVLVSLVSLSGRLSQDCLLDLENVRLQFDTGRPSREGQVYRQAAVSCQVTRVKPGDSLDIVCHMEDGLMDLRLEKTD